MANQIKNFFLSNNNVSMIYQVINQNLQKRNYNINNEIKQKLQDIQQNIMNMVYQSKDYYLQLENVTNNSEKIKILNRKVIDRCNIEFANILESQSVNTQQLQPKPPNYPPKQPPQPSQQQLKNSMPYKTTDYSNLSMDDALSQLMASRKTTPPILNNIPPQPIQTKNENNDNNEKHQIKDIKNTNTKTSINFYDMDSQIKKIIQKENENNENNEKQQIKDTNENDKEEEIKNKNKFVENIKLKIEKRKQDLSKTSSSILNKNDLQSKINEFKQIQKKVSVPSNLQSIKTNKIIHKLAYSVDKDWGGFWNLKKEHNIIVNRELVLSSHNSYKFNYFIKNNHQIHKLKINRFILPINRKNPNNIDLVIYIEIKNLHVRIPLYFYKQVNNLLYYQPNQNSFYTVNSNSMNSQNKHLMVSITNHLQNILKEKDAFIIKTLKVNNSSNNKINFKNYITLEFNVDLSLHNKIMNNDTIILKNINLRNFIKFNQEITNEKIKQFEEWLVNTEHMVLFIDKATLFIGIDDLNLKWINSSLAKSTINNIKKQNLGIMLNKTTQHLIDMSYM